VFEVMETPQTPSLKLTPAIALCYNSLFTTARLLIISSRRHLLPLPKLISMDSVQDLGKLICRFTINLLPVLSA
jgi:hypothetical protein